MAGSDGASRERFLREYGQALEEGRAAFFAGAGLSKAAGYVDWRDLLREFAAELDLNIDEEHDLPLVAQYHLDANNQQKNRLSQKLRDAFTDGGTTSVYEAVARLRVPVVWTTNYDDAVEKAMEAAGLKPDIKPNGNRGSWTTSRKGSKVAVYKMHGDISDPSNLVLSRDDYDTYARDYPYVLDTLRAQMVERTFLFAGFSFTDPNLDHVLAAIRSYWGRDAKSHWVLTRRSGTPREAAKQRLWATHLLRYGLNVVFLDDHDEVLSLLDELATRLQRRHVLVSGSAHEAGPLGRDRLDRLAAGVGAAIIEGGRNLVSGIGLGVGSAVLTGAAQAVYDAGDDPARRLRLHPFPRPTEDVRAETWRRWRESMIRTAGYAVFIAGNKHDGTDTVLADGVMQEFEIAVAAGAYPLPIGASGWAAQRIHEMVAADFDRYLPGAPRAAFADLGDPHASNDRLIDALRTLLEALQP
jgi:hypothetical protein